MSDTNPYADPCADPCPAPSCTWSCSFPGHADQLSAVRAFTSDHLSGLPCSEDAVLLVTELASNAVRHTRSGGDHFDVEIRVSETARVAVSDLGSDRPPCRRHPEPLQQGGRGLELLDALAPVWGFTRCPAGTTVWFEMPLHT